uniref:uncharacterized protein LOC122598231 n=1 Tax=Erigeron canadensis TaxID=72917 RepID=UPI001CB9BD7D|nr:uncharacterized protein LOC122598231 [Erigeron canadensis]
MEGGVFEDERIIGIGNKRGRDQNDEKEGEKIVGRLGKRPSGIVVMDEEDQDQYSYSGDEMINGVKYEEEKSSTPTSATAGGGFFNQLITNLVNSPKSSADRHGCSANKFGHGSGEIVAGGGDDDDDGHVVVENGGGAGADHENNNDKENGGGESIIDDIVAKLPRTLSEDTVTAPEPDEASILLHSIIHD